MFISFLFVGVSYADDNNGFPTEPSSSGHVSIVELYNRIQSLQDRVSELTDNIELLKHKNEILEERIKGVEGNKGVNTLPADSSNQSGGGAKATQGKVGAGSPSSTSSAGADKSLSETDLFATAYNAMLNQNYHKALSLFDRFVNTYPRSSKVSDALYWVGEIYYSQENYLEASRVYLRSSRMYPHGDKAAQSILRLASSLRHLNKIREACRMSHFLIKNYPSKKDADIVEQGRKFYDENGCDSYNE